MAHMHIYENHMQAGIEHAAGLLPAVQEPLARPLAIPWPSLGPQPGKPHFFVLITPASSNRIIDINPKLQKIINGEKIKESRLRAKSKQSATLAEALTDTSKALACVGSSST